MAPTACILSFRRNIVPVPTHGPSCQTLIYPTNCWYCGRPIHVLQCTCGSAVLLDQPKPPWPEHDCSAGGIGGSGLSGWAAVDVLKANGIPIDANIMAKVFPAMPRSGKAPAAPHESMAAIQPKVGAKVDLVAIVRELLRDTKKTDRLNALGDVGSKLLKLPKGDLWQLTLVANSERPNLTYTCIIPARLGLPKDAKNKMVFSHIEARVVGTHAIWLVTEIQLV
jgi:hypothetical protein